MNTDIAFLPRERLQDLLTSLQGEGFRCVGPVEKDGAIVFSDISSINELPVGVTDRQSPGHYRLNHTEDKRYFAWANGPQALKPMLFRSRELLWTCEKDETGKLVFKVAEPEIEPKAVIGVRSCDLAALHLQDKHFLQSDYKDPYYLARRQKLFLVAVNCTHPASTCFCASTGDGPRASYGFDLALTELSDGFIVEAHSDPGMEQIQKLALEDADTDQIIEAEELLHNAKAVQTREIPGGNLYEQLFSRLEHPQWDDVASRCLACGNCTAVCPTCFCHNQHDVPDLNGDSSGHYREWDSCFSVEHSYIHGLQVRDDIRSRYRQWLTHKLGSWHLQYGRSGCVGCGRCISWCPVGIDITKEVVAVCEDGIL